MSGEEGDDPAADRVALRAALVDTVVDLGAAGADNIFGSGRVNGVSAGQSLATPTPTPTPVPGPVPWSLAALALAFIVLLTWRLRHSISSRRT